MRERDVLKEGDRGVLRKMFLFNDLSVSREPVQAGEFFCYSSQQFCCGSMKCLVHSAHEENRPEDFVYVHWRLPAFGWSSGCQRSDDDGPVEFR